MDKSLRNKRTSKEILQKASRQGEERGNPMNEVSFIVLATGKEVTKYFDDLKQQRLFLLRCKHSKKVFVTGYTYQSQAQYEYLEYGW